MNPQSPTSLLSREDILNALSALGEDPVASRVDQVRELVDAATLPMGEPDEVIRAAVDTARQKLDQRMAATDGGAPERRLAAILARVGQGYTATQLGGNLALGLPNGRGGISFAQMGRERGLDKIEQLRATGIEARLSQTGSPGKFVVVFSPESLKSAVEEDFSAHHVAWCDALVIAQRSGLVAPLEYRETRDWGGTGYWDEEIRAIERTLSLGLYRETGGDVQTHRPIWRYALEHARIQAWSDPQERTYWGRALDAFDRAFGGVDANPKAPGHHWTEADSDAAAAQSWNLFETYGDKRELRLQCVDEDCEFPNDEAAAQHVKDMAENGDPVAIRAIRALIATCSEDVVRFDLHMPGAAAHLQPEKFRGEVREDVPSHSLDL
ncbi:hypothetical protein [Ralstonia sp. ASV6]|uniref:hypothetical protein n=1 Tax=Ralstonia sp. ASV6 TaxID=2795124 RepID=UPI0018EDB545|nr:hypothetical protein [Ralstonia sp. ASV6]